MQGRSVPVVRFWASVIEPKGQSVLMSELRTKWFLGSLTEIACWFFQISIDSACPALA